MRHKSEIAQRGFSLIMAIFLIVVMAGMAVFLARVSSMQYHASALDEEGILAYQAARAGIEWGAYNARKVAVYPCPGAADPDTLTLSGALANYTVSVTCVKTTATEGSTLGNVILYKITSTAKNGNSPAGDYYVERQLQATVAK